MKIVFNPFTGNFDFVGGDVTPPTHGPSILMETTDYLLLETGDTILLE